ncbi:alpha/beta fold hydrolase [Allomuricauda sp. R78024]|uniref:alpha/beta fold hydrolase n=1 Tax=Allomuricauda sp. R78024 TaxID=3093867 RepID=UPI0037C7FD50
MRLFSVILICFCAFQAFGQGEFLTLDDSTQLYIEESGSGQTILFIPGWTMTHRFFEKQKEHFSNQYHVLSYDPRGQGRSDKTLFGNTYAYHATDLYQILQKKSLKNVILVGWSSGCLTMYEYLHAYGFDRIDKMVFIDEPPKWIGDVDREWVYGSFDDYRGSLKSLISEPSDPNGIIDWMLANPIDSSTRAWMNKEILMTPPHVALNLYIDGIASDYTQEVASMQSKGTALFMVRASWYDQAANWLKQTTPKSKVASISSHAMFWESPKKFNQILSTFLNANIDKK